MATLLKVGHTIVNLDTVTYIELKARSSLPSEQQPEPVIRIHFVPPAGTAWAASSIPPGANHRTLAIHGDDAEAFRRYLEYEALDITNEQALEQA